MSENILYLIPVDLYYLPSPIDAQKACALVTSFLSHAHQVMCHFTDEVRFVGGGSNLEKIFCPTCHSLIDDEWWSSMMDTVYEQNRFQELTVRVPCRNTLCSLNDLRYELPAGFARFSIEIDNPGHDVDDDQMLLIEELVQMKLKKVWLHI